MNIEYIFRGESLDCTGAQCRFKFRKRQQTAFRCISQRKTGSQFAINKKAVAGLMFILDHCVNVLC